MFFRLAGGKSERILTIMANIVGVPLPTLRRLPLYYRLFKEKKAVGDEWLSSEIMSQVLGFGAIQVRKDLGAIGAAGSPKRGYPIAQTIEILNGFLGVNDYTDVFLVGSGVLGAAVLADKGLEQHGFKIVAIFDLSPERVDQIVAGKKVFPLEKLPDLTKRMGVKLAILAVDQDQVGPAADVLVRAGVGAVLDLTGASIYFPSDILVTRVNFSASLASLAGELKGRSS